MGLIEGEMVEDIVHRVLERILPKLYCPICEQRRFMVDIRNRPRDEKLPIKRPKARFRCLGCLRVLNQEMVPEELEATARKELK